MSVNAVAAKLLEPLAKRKRGDVRVGVADGNGPVNNDQ